MSVVPSDIALYASLCLPAFDGAATLNGALTSSATSCPINTPSASFPSSGEFAVAFSSGEIAWVSQGAPGASSGTLTLIRGFAGTSQAAQTSSTNVTMPMGAGIDFLTKAFFTDVTSGDTLDYVSTSSGDTKPQVIVTVRDTTGIIKQETKTLNGQTIVAGSQVCDRIEDFSLAAVTTATGALTTSSVTLTISSASSLTSSGNFYIQMAKEVMLVSSGQATSSLTITRGQMGTTTTAHNSGDNVYLLPLGDIAALDHTKVISAHTAQTGSANATGTTPALFKLQAGDGASVSIGQIIRTSSGTGSQQMRTIIATSGYGTDIVAVSRNWSVVPDNTTVYDVFNGVQLDLSPNQITSCRRFLWNAAADVPGGSQKTYYEKLFAVNNNTATAFTAAQFEVASNSPSLPSSSLLDLALATALADTVSAVNRQTALSSGYGSFTTQPAYILMTANSGNLPSGAAPNAAGALGIELRLTLPAGTTSYKGAADFRAQGQTV